MKELRKEISIKLIQKINGTIGNLLQDVKHTDETTTFHLGRRIESPEIHVNGDSARYSIKNSYLTVLLIMDNNHLIIIRSLDRANWEAYYMMALQDVDVDTTFNELCNAIGYRY